MPPKIKVKQEEIIEAALEIVRQQGMGAVNARTVATALGCSTQPVFSNFATMEDLQEAVVRAAYERYLLFLQREAEEGRYPPYKAFGMAYIRFAKEEKELFKLLFMRDRNGSKLESTPDWEFSIRAIMTANGLPKEKAELIHMEMWAFVHGIATMLVTSFADLEWEMISRMMTDVYQGVCAKLVSEERMK